MMNETRIEWGRIWRQWGLVVGIFLVVGIIEPVASFSFREGATSCSTRKSAERTTVLSSPCGRKPLSPLNAVGIPLDDSISWGSPRTTRIHSVLQKAQRRTGLDSFTLPRPTSAAAPRSTTRSTSSVQQQQTLPFGLPVLSEAQKLALKHEEIVMEQSEMGRQGSGFVVQDVRASEETIWDCLLDFEGYQNNIPTVRAARVRHSTIPRKYDIPSITRASFDVSRFLVTISAIFHYHPQLHYMELSLDNAIQNTALQSAKGYWYTERLVDNNNNDTEKTRVWLLCDLTVSPLLPAFVVDVAAQSAMPRASSWLRPTAAARRRRRLEEYATP